MAPATVGKNTQIDAADAEDWTHVLGILELPRTGQRWTVRRKATVVETVRGGWMPVEEACRVYNVSVHEFLAWERDMHRNGVPGLRRRRYQIYRDTQKKSA
jgi:Protein of unknown function (DUF1153)